MGIGREDKVFNDSSIPKAYFSVYNVPLGELVKTWIERRHLGENCTYQDISIHTNGGNVQEISREKYLEMDVLEYRPYIKP